MWMNSKVGQNAFLLEWMKPKLEENNIQSYVSIVDNYACDRAFKAYSYARVWAPMFQTLIFSHDFIRHDIWRKTNNPAIILYLHSWNKPLPDVLRLSKAIFSTLTFFLVLYLILPQDGNMEICSFCSCSEDILF